MQIFYLWDDHLFRIETVVGGFQGNLSLDNLKLKNSVRPLIFALITQQRGRVH